MFFRKKSYVRFYSNYPGVRESYPVKKAKDHKHSWLESMNKDFVKQHSFWIDKIVFLDDEPIYKIDFLSSIQGMDRYFKGSGSSI